jgi:hypothetical protein
MYHPIVQKLDSAATDLYALSPELGKATTIFTGQVHRMLSVNGKTRYFDAQWCWALGHLGILYQMIRCFKKFDPEAKLVLETQGKVSNETFLNYLRPHIEVVENLPESIRQEAMLNSVYFGCPDGKNHIHDWVKQIEKRLKGEPLLSLTEIDKISVDLMLTKLGVSRPYVAVQARCMDYDPKRNVTEKQVVEALAPYEGFGVVSTGLDVHPIDTRFPSVKSFPNPKYASFVLSASCDQFVGSDSGAWVIPWSFNKPVHLINDKDKAWIYP